MPLLRVGQILKHTRIIPNSSPAYPPEPRRRLRRAGRWGVQRGRGWALQPSSPLQGPASLRSQAPSVADGENAFDEFLQLSFLIGSKFSPACAEALRIRHDELVRVTVPQRAIERPALNAGHIRRMSVFCIRKMHADNTGKQAKRAKKKKTQGASAQSCRSANASPHRAHGRLSLPSVCTLPGAYT